MARDVTRPAVDRRTFAALLLEFGLAWGLTVWAALVWLPWVVLAVMFVVATRQHALFILFHDAVHGLVARERRVNDLIINGLVGVPQLVPVQVYRRLHLAHHARLGSEGDPERVLLYRGQPWQYRALPLSTLARQVLGDLLLLNTARTLWGFERERRDPASPLALGEKSHWPETWPLIAAWAGAVALGFALSPEVAAKVVCVWLVPLFTWTQALQKVRSFLEHGGPDGEEPTYSWRPGLLGRLIVWPYHIAYHREHHESPRVPWHALPARFVDSPPTKRPWWRILWNGRLRGRADA